MSRASRGRPRWLLVTLLVLAAVVLVPLGWMLCVAMFGGMGGMMGGGGMMGMHGAGLVGMVLLLVLLVALIVAGLRQLSGRSSDGAALSETAKPGGDADPGRTE